MSRRPTFDPSRIKVPQEERPRGKGPMLLTVSAVTQAVKSAIARALPPTVHVVGELSNYKRHSSGHLYFTLKDREAELSCVMWRSAAGQLKFRPEGGMEVIATGTVDVYPKSGRYQLYVRALEPRGIGALELAFRQLREKLEGEGLFDPAHKKPLPPYPQRIAIVTSPTGAAVRDILQTLRRRHPGLSVFVYPVRVQGEQARGEIVTAIAAINRHQEKLGGIDVMIVSRGGGSLEDLWAFNEEVVARAIFASRIPIISGVGHEVDVTIADLVADVRAATPTAAAELAVSTRSQLVDRITDLFGRLDRSMRFRISLADERLQRVAGHAALTQPMQAVRQREQSLDNLMDRLDSGCELLLTSVRDRLRRCELGLIRRGPADILAKRTRRLLETDYRLRWGLSRIEIIRERTLERVNQQLSAANPAYRVGQMSERVAQLEARLIAGSPTKVLQRGFSITRIKKSGTLLVSASDVRHGDRILTETRDGTIESEVFRQRQLELFDEQKSLDAETGNDS